MLSRTNIKPALDLRAVALISFHSPNKVCFTHTKSFEFSCFISCSATHGDLRVALPDLGSVSADLRKEILSYRYSILKWNDKNQELEPTGLQGNGLAASQFPIVFQNAAFGYYVAVVDGVRNGSSENGTSSLSLSPSVVMTSSVVLDFNYTGQTPSIPVANGVWQSYAPTGDNRIAIVPPPRPQPSSSTPPSTSDAYDEVVYVFKNPALNRTVRVVANVSDSSVQVPVEELGGSPIEYYFFYGHSAADKKNMTSARSPVVTFEPGE